MAGKDDKVKKMSYPIATFFSTEKKGNEYQFVKLGFYDEKLTFNFYKGTGGGGSEGANAYISLDYEMASFVKSLIDAMVRHRVMLYRSKAPYDELSFAYDITFADKDGGGTRTAGNLAFKTAPVTTDDSNVVHLQFSNGTAQFDIALGCQGFIKNISYSDSDNVFEDIDKADSRLYAFSYIIHTIIQNWPILMQQDKFTSVMLTRLNAMMEKMGVSLDYNQRNDKYPDKYRSSGSNSQENADTPF